MRSEIAISERQACGLLGIYRSTLRNEAQQTEQTQALSSCIVELAQESAAASVIGAFTPCCDAKAMRSITSACIAYTARRTLQLNAGNGAKA